MPDPSSNQPSAESRTHTKQEEEAKEKDTLVLNQKKDALKEYAQQQDQAHEATRVNEYWRRNKVLMYKLGCIWFIVSYVFGILLVDYLNTIRIGGYKLGFWFAQQGSIYTFIVLIFYYTKAMEKLDQEFNVEEE